MTDRYNALFVCLDRDIRADDAQALIDAIQLLRGVLKVEGHIATPEAWIAEVRAREHLKDRLRGVLFDNPTG